MRTIAFICACLWSSVGLTCTKDTDCKGDRICIEGGCTNPTTRERTTNDQKKPEKTGSRSFHFNILGLLQFGLTPTVEWGEQTTFLARARILNTGALAYLMSAMEDEDFIVGLGLSGQIRHYLGQQAQDGPFFGGGLEILYSQSEGDETYETYYVAPQFEAGYRWNQVGYFSSVGAFLGTGLPVHTEGYDDGASIVTGGFHWDIGWYF